MTPLILAALFLPLVILATLRLTRLVTTDWLGEWLIVAPAKRWAIDRQMRGTITTISPTATTNEIWARFDDAAWNDPSMKWQMKLVKGLDCPFCVGFWIGLILLNATALVLILPEWAVTAWALFLGSFALNYVVGHVAARID